MLVCFAFFLIPVVLYFSTPVLFRWFPHNLRFCNSSHTLCCLLFVVCCFLQWLIDGFVLAVCGARQRLRLYCTWVCASVCVHVCVCMCAPLARTLVSSDFTSSTQEMQDEVNTAWGNNPYNITGTKAAAVCPPPPVACNPPVPYNVCGICVCECVFVCVSVFV